MKLTFILLTVASVSLLPSLSTAGLQLNADKSQVATGKEEFDPKRDAAQDIAVALKMASKENKRVLLNVGGNWCSWCKKLDGLLRSDKDISRILKDKYVVVPVNYSQENPNRAILSKYPQVTGYPHLFVLDVKGKVIKSQDTSELEDLDKYDTAKVLSFLKHFVP